MVFNRSMIVKLLLFSAIQRQIIEKVYNRPKKDHSPVVFQYFFKYPQITKAGDDCSPPLILPWLKSRQHAKLLFSTLLTSVT